jgi:hypothetical protein
MKINNRLILIPCLFIAYLTQGQNIEFKTRVPSKVQVGEEFVLTYTINRKAEGIKLEKALSDFKIIHGPGKSTSNSTSISNGVMTQTQKTRFNYSLVAQKTGVFSLPFASITIDNIKYYSDSASIIVTEKDTSSLTDINNDSDIIFAKLMLSKDTAYKQEPVVAWLRVYSNLSISSIENIEIPKSENFLLYELSSPEKLEMKTDTLDNEILKSALVKKLLLIPTKSGTFNIQKLKIDGRVKKPNPKQSNVFDDFFNTHQTESRSFYSRPIDIAVMDYKDEIPNDFSYISGNDLKISVSTNKPVVQRNEQFKFSVAISGVGNLKLLGVPKIQFPENIKLIRNEYTNHLKVDTMGIHGERIFSFYMYSDSCGKFEIPSYSISYYNLKDNKIKTTHSPTVLMEVTKNDSTLAVPEINIEESAKPLTKEAEFATFIIMDLSTSMLAQDFKPNRMASVINAINDYIIATKQSVGIIAYSSIPYLLSPVTTNEVAIIDAMKRTDSLKLGDGTSTGLAICMALDKLQTENAKHKNITLITDGESNKGAINEKMAIELAKYFKIPVNIIGVSAETERVPITINTEFGNHTTTIPVQIDDKQLSALSDQTGGRYYRAVDNSSLKKALKAIEEDKHTKVAKDSTATMYTTQEIQGLINLMYQDVLQEREGLKTE